MTDRMVRLLRKYRLTPLIGMDGKEFVYPLLLKLDSKQHLTSLEISDLIRFGLYDLAEFAIKFNQEKIEDFSCFHDHDIDSQTQEFDRLERRFNIRPHRKNFFYRILRTLEQKRRLPEKKFLWLQEHNLVTKEILIAYYTIEATFYEQEYQQTKNLWNIVNASSCWRTAEQPQKALQLIDQIQIEIQKNRRLQSALFTTQGGAFRDIQELNNAEQCAHQAITAYSKSYQSYTLLGAICFDKGNYSQGKSWFEEAVQRGASPKSVDTEIERIVKRVKGKKRQELLEYLLQTDSLRYDWVTRFKNPKKHTRNTKYKKKQKNIPSYK